MNTTKMVSIVLGLLFGALFISSLATAGSENGIGYHEQNGVVTLTTPNATIIVHTESHEPIFQYFTDDGFNYTVIFKQLIEYYDTNNDGAFQYNECIPGVPILTLTSVKWDFSGFKTETDANNVITAVHFNFTATEQMGKMYTGDLEMIIAAHIYLYDTTIGGGYTIEGGAELKFDIIINSFPWLKEDSNLAIRFDITPAKGAKMVDNHGHQINTSENNTNKEQRMEHIKNQMKQQVEIKEGNHAGYFAFANQSRIRMSNETQFRNEQVNASIGTDGTGNVRIFLSFSHFEQLEYDPSIGSTTIEETSNNESNSITTTVPFAFGLIIVTIGAIALVKFSRKH